MTARSSDMFLRRKRVAERVHGIFNDLSPIFPQWLSLVNVECNYRILGNQRTVADGQHVLNDLVAVKQRLVDAGVDFSTPDAELEITGTAEVCLM